MMEFLECGKVEAILNRLGSGMAQPLRDFQRSAHHRLRSEEGISYCALVRSPDDIVTVIMGNDRKEVETWIGIREVDAELMELRDIMFH